MSECDIKDSIIRLRELRDQLCTNDSEFKKALEVRDCVINGLEQLQVSLDDDKTEKKECALKLKKILEYYEDNNNV